MSRPAAPSFGPLGRLRQFYGLSQTELAALLGLSGAQLSRLEAGRQAITREVAARLAPFLAPLEAAVVAPAPEGPAAPAAGPDTPPPGPFEAGPLQRRRAACLHEAHNLRWRLRHLPEQAAVAARRAATLPALLAALPPPPPAGTAPTTPEAVRLRYVHAWLATLPLALPPEVLADWHLAHQRARALEAEAAALGALLGEEPAGAAAG